MRRPPAVPNAASFSAGSAKRSGIPGCSTPRLAFPGGATSCRSVPSNQREQPIQFRWITNKRHQYKNDEGCDDNDTYDNEARSNARDTFALCGAAFPQEPPRILFSLPGTQHGQSTLVTVPFTWPRTRWPWPIPVQSPLASASTARPSVRSGGMNQTSLGLGRASRKATTDKRGPQREATNL